MLYGWEVFIADGPVNHVAWGYHWDIWSPDWLTLLRCMKRPTKATWAAGNGADVRSVQRDSRPRT